MRTHRSRRAHLRSGLGEQAVGHLEDRAGHTVADLELGDLGVGRQPEVAERVFPRRLRPGGGGLREVAEDRHRRPRAGPAGQHPQRHGRQVLRLVDHDVAIAPWQPGDQPLGLVDERRCPRSSTARRSADPTALRRIIAAARRRRGRLSAARASAARLVRSWRTTAGALIVGQMRSSAAARRAVVAEVLRDLLARRRGRRDARARGHRGSDRRRPAERIAVELPRPCERERVVHRLAERHGTQPHRPPARRQHDLLGRRPKAGAARVADHVRHPSVALHGADSRAARWRARGTTRRAAPARWSAPPTSRRATADLRDVAQEHGVRADHEHALTR